MDVGLVCDACNALTPIGVPRCRRCGEPVALEPQPARPPTPAAGVGAGPARGGRPTAGAPPARLTLIRADGIDGDAFPIGERPLVVGRAPGGLAFPDDPFLSPRHATFALDRGGLRVVDEGSLNGVYVRITGTVAVPYGTRLLIGEQVLSAAPAFTPEDLPDPDGTFCSASMPRPARLTVTQHLRGGGTGAVYRLAADAVTIGREGNDLDFRDDPFISGRHAEVRLAAGAVEVTDRGSRNGTFARITSARVLRDGDHVFLGQQLLRVDLP